MSTRTWPESNNQYGIHILFFANQWLSQLIYIHGKM